MLTLLRVLWNRTLQERSSKWSREALERHQQSELQALRRFARERSAFYARFHKGMEARPLIELPILTKGTLMENFDSLVTDSSIHLADAEAYLKQQSAALFLNRYVALATSGSTGRHGVFLFSPTEWIRALASITRPLSWAGVHPKRSALIASTTQWHYSARIGAMLSSRFLPSMRLDATEPLESMVRKLNDWQPDNLAAYPSVLKQLAEEQIAGRLQIKLRSSATSAEVLTPETRRRVQQAWNIKVFDTYGATEYAPIAAECIYGRKHLFEDGAIIEVVDEKGRVLPPGESGDRILLTVFHRRTQPLIRYEISDMVRVLDTKCECGRPFRVIESVEGRLEDVLHFPPGVSIHPNVFHQVLEMVPASGWQVVQEDGVLSVHLTGLDDPTTFRAIEDEIRKLLAAQGAAVPEIRAGKVDALPRGASGKAPLIVCKRTQNR